MNIYSSIDSFLKYKKDQDMAFFYYRGIILPISYKVGTSDKLVIFVPGAYDRSQVMPKFQRQSYFNDFMHSSISLFDPTLYFKDYLPIGWFQGTKELFYAEAVGEFLVEFIEKVFHIDYKNILFFSTSAGGIPAVKMGSFFPKCSLYLGNIQTNIFRYTIDHYKLLLWATIQSSSVDQYKSDYAGRYHIYNPILDCNLYYAQNLADEFHYKNHYQPFMMKLDRENILHLESILYHEPVSGHNPISKKVELEVIEEILYYKSINNTFCKYLAEE